MEEDNLIWSWFDGEYRVHCETRELYDKIIRWKGCRHGSIYYFPGGTLEYDVTIPGDLRERAIIVLRKYYQSKTRNPSAKSTLNVNDLQKQKSALSDDLKRGHIK